MYGVADAMRSLKKYVADKLGADWEVRLWDEEGEFDYPFVRILAAGGALYSGPVLWQDVIQPVAIHAYASPSQTTADAVIAAMQVEDALYSAFFNVRRPARVPLYDYDGVPLSDPGVIRQSHDYLHVVDFSTEQMASPEDDRLRWVVATMRLKWGRPAKVKPAEKVVKEVRVEQEPG
jgi:hypothetical protein